MILCHEVSKGGDFGAEIKIYVFTGGLESRDM
jgi:hypothetical protein